MSHQTMSDDEVAEYVTLMKERAELSNSARSLKKKEDGEAAKEEEDEAEIWDPVERDYLEEEEEQRRRRGARYVPDRDGEGGRAKQDRPYDRHKKRKFRRDLDDNFVSDDDQWQDDGID